MNSGDQTDKIEGLYNLFLAFKELIRTKKYKVIFFILIIFLMLVFLGFCVGS